MKTSSITIEQIVGGKPQSRVHDLKLEYACSCDPCDCYLVPQERDYCSPECKCYEGLDSCYCD